MIKSNWENLEYFSVIRTSMHFDLVVLPHISRIRVKWFIYSDRSALFSLVLVFEVKSKEKLLDTPVTPLEY